MAFNFPLEVEHIVPRAIGPDENRDNLAIACRSCNIFNGTRISAVDNDTSELVPLFHPRNNRWGEHFEVDAATLAIRATTATGRVTITTLQLNSSEQLHARRRWIRLELFP